MTLRRERECSGFQTLLWRRLDVARSAEAAVKWNKLLKDMASDSSVHGIKMEKKKPPKEEHP